MEYLSWLLVGIFALVACWQFSAARGAYRKLNTLNEYIQFCSFSRTSITITVRNFLSSWLKNLPQTFPIRRWLHTTQLRTWQSS